VEREGIRRWFSDEFFDLIVWYDYSHNIDGFQLCYDKDSNERALTWMINGNYRHDRIENGETPYSSKKTPIILRDGVFNKQKIAALFKKEAKSIDKEIADLVYHKILEYE
jgi:hypothetical protein